MSEVVCKLNHKTPVFQKQATRNKIGCAYSKFQDRKPTDSLETRSITLSQPVRVKGHILRSGMTCGTGIIMQDVLYAEWFKEIWICFPNRDVIFRIIILFLKSYHSHAAYSLRLLPSPLINMFWYQIFCGPQPMRPSEGDAAVAFSPVFLLASRLFRWGKYHSFLFMSLYHKMLFFFSVSSCRLSVFWKKIVVLIWGHLACRQNHLEGLINYLVLLKD